MGADSGPFGMQKAGDGPPMDIERMSRLLFRPGHDLRRKFYAQMLCLFDHFFANVISQLQHFGANLGLIYTQMLCLFNRFFANVISL